MPPKRGIREVRAEFNDLLNKANETGYDRKFPCFNKPEKFVDYTSSPTPAEAEEMCAGCPIYAEHREYGEVTRPGWGVHGGIAYRDGIPLRPAKEATEPKAA